MSKLLYIVFLLFPLFGTSQTATWTVQTLKEYTDQRFDAMQMAVLKAEQATEKRFEGVNEFRNTLADQQRTFLPRVEYESNHGNLVAQIRELKEQIYKMENLKQGGNIVWAYIISGVSLLVAFISVYKKNFSKP